MGCTRGAIDI